MSTLKHIDSNSSKLADGNRELFPLTSYQKDIWIKHKLNEKTPQGNIGAYAEIDGSLNYAKLNRAVQKIVSSVDSLRLRIIEKAGVAYQYFENHADYTMPIIDYTQNEFTTDDALDWINDRFSIPFKLTERLFDLVLLKVSNTKHFWLIKAHHLIVDGWSLTNLIKKIVEVYNVSDIDLTEVVSPSFKSLMESDQNYLSSNRYQSDREFWKKELANVPESIFSYKSNITDSITSKRTSFNISRETYSKIQSLCESNKFSEFSYFLGIISLYFFRFYRLDRMIINIPVLNRSKKERQIIGHCVNTIPIVIEISSTDSFIHHVKRITGQFSKFYKHSKLAFGEIQRELVEANTRLFDVTLSFDIHDTNQFIESANLSTTILSHNHEQNALFLLVHAAGKNTDPVIYIDYLLELFGNVYPISSFISHLKEIIKQTLKNSDVPISGIDILPKTERSKIKQVFNNTKMAFPKTCIHQLFEEQVSKTPHAIAAIFKEEKVTFEQLNSKANQVARFLIKKGAQNSDAIGICMERSVLMIIGLLSILKAGCSHVGIDPKYPLKRNRHIFSNSCSTLLISQESLSQLAQQVTDSVIYLDSDLGMISQEATENLNLDVNLEQTSYILYTSGSTGLPKGAMVTHKNVTNFLFAMQQILKFTADDSTVAISSYAVDMHVLDLFFPMIFGGKTILATSEMIKDPILLGDVLNKNNITFFQATPATWKMLIYSNWKSCRNMICFCGAEPMTDKIKNTLLRDKNIVLWNMYGPTETTVWSSATRIRTINDKITIGKPIGNTQIYIIDNYMNLVPIGIPGELCISGAGVARGYLNNPNLTEEKFVDNPFDTTSKLYKTGDIARYLPDGNLEFIGRKDNQVKLRGFRIELGEIEYAIGRIPNIKESVAVVEETEEDKYIVAYVVTNEELNSDEIKSQLSRTLPEYMIPSYIVCIERLPTTPNGKIDRKMLPSPKEHIENRSAYKPPQDEIERKCVQIWEEVLGVEKVGLNDNFFDLGGHSLLAAQITAKIKLEIQANIEIAAIFENPVLYQLTHEIKNRNRNFSYSTVEPKPRGKNIPLSTSQERLWFIYQMEKNSSYNMAGAIRIHGEVDRNEIELTFRYLIERHEILRTNFTLVDGEPVQVINDSINWSLNYFDFSNKNSGFALKEVFSKMKYDSQHVFDLENEPLLLTNLFKIKPGDFILFMNMHHIIGDGWSLSIFAEELSEIFESTKGNKRPNLNNLEIQYADYAIWERENNFAEKHFNQLSYWKNKLVDVPVLALPTDKIRPKKQTFNGSQYKFEINSELLNGLKKMSQNSKVTLFMTMLSAFSVFLSKYSNQTDICIGTAAANRSQLKVENLIGLFINSIALRISLDPNQSFTDLLNLSRDTVLEAFDNQEVPIEKVIKEVKPDRDLSHPPLFQVMMVMHTEQRYELKFSDYKIDQIELHNDTSKFDLLLDIVIKEDSLKCTFEYNSDLFEDATLKRMKSHYINILNCIVVNPHVKIKDISMMGIEEKAWFIRDTLREIGNHSDQKTISERLEFHVENRPDEIAIVSTKESITYADFYKKLTKFANHMKSLGLSKGDCVVISLKRSIDSVISVYAVLAMGCVYVPVDSNAPKSRKESIILDCNPKIIIQDHENDMANIPHSASVVAMCDVWQKISLPISTEIKTETFQEDLAYVIYTSGTSGQPKGVMVEHRNLLHYIDEFTKYFQLSYKDSLLMQANIAFDTSIEEMFPILLAGGRLCIVDELEVMNLSLLSEYISNNSVSIVSCSPLLLSELNKVGKLDGVKHFISGGDVLKYSYIDNLFKSSAIWNTYGPTEATICSSYYKVDKLGQNEVPIGKPIGNTQIYIIDNYMNLVPIGIPGELCISGAGVARGYLNNPNLTEEKFVDNPFDTTSKLYKTGDIARYLPDGNLEFIGRKDNQVKLRGFRIELGEIEYAIGRIPNIKESVAVVEETEEDKYIVAYVVTNEELNSDEIKSQLSRTLPEYMIPSYIVCIERLPTTPNGKIDRKMLPSPKEHIENRSAYKPPQDEIERKCVQIWEEVLGVEKVGLNDNFFDLGGHSLLAMRLVSEFNKEFSNEITISDLFEYPTISSISVLLRGEASNTWSPLIKLNNSNSGIAAFCIPGIGVSAICFKDLSNYLGDTCSVYGLQYAGIDSGTLPSETIEAIAALNIDAMKEQHPHGPYFLIAHSFGGMVGYEIAHQLLKKNPKEEVNLILLDSYSPLYGLTGKNTISTSQILANVVNTIYQYIGIENQYTSDEFSTLTIEEVFNNTIGSTLSSNVLNLVPDLDHFTRMIELTEVQMNMQYSPNQSSLNVSITLYKAKDNIQKNPTLGWEKYSSHEIEVVPTNGEHVNLIRSPYIGEIALGIKQKLVRKTN
jgi:amino acid adenylation domain-containing protein